MKKILLLSVFALCATLNINAQERESGDIEIAPYIGYMSSFFNGDNIDAYDSRNAISFGVKADYFFNNRWSLRSGLSYDSMGAEYFGTEAKLDYLNIPINANWHFGSTRKWNLNFGVSPGFLLSAEDAGADAKDLVEPFQLGVSYGIGYKLEVSEQFSILFDFQGLVGVTNFQKAEGAANNMNAGSGLSIGGVFKL
ncbi:porin family protein [Lacinutrix jangbogonensis]|uniref:porin family protein n=1 Tax=Lacinutrix jangbogonensis TaxID=1469557 RepID=UPI00053D7F99|nr:porin family protein [Lacinutrix jangbogonensis]